MTDYKGNSKTSVNYGICNKSKISRLPWCTSLGPWISVLLMWLHLCFGAWLRQGTNGMYISDRNHVSYHSVLSTVRFSYTRRCYGYVFQGNIWLVIMWKFWLFHLYLSFHSIFPKLQRNYFQYKVSQAQRGVESMLTHWGRATHICVGKLTTIGSDNGLAPGRRQAIIWTIAGILLVGPLGTNFSEISIGIQLFSFKKMHLKMSSAKWRPFVSASMC